MEAGKRRMPRPKLRLTASELVSELERYGFIIDDDEAGPHLHSISARKP